MAEAGGVHRRGDDRLAVGVTAGALVVAQQVRDPGQVLGELPVWSGVGRFGQQRVADAGRGVQVGGGEPGRDIDDPAAGGIDPGRVAAGQLGQRFQQTPGGPGRIGGSGPGARRSGVGGPLLRPHGGDDQAALTLEEVGQAAQHRRAAVGVGVLAQLAQPQHCAIRDPRLQPRRQRAGVQRVIHPPVRKPVGDCLVGGAGLARGGPAADHHQPAGGHGGVQDGPQQLIVRPADIRRHRSAADHLVHAQLHRSPLGRPAAIGRLSRGAGQRAPAQVRGRQAAQDRHGNSGHAQVKQDRQQQRQRGRGQRRQACAPRTRATRRPARAPASQTVHHRRDTPLSPHAPKNAYGRPGFVTACGRGRARPGAAAAPQRSPGRTWPATAPKYDLTGPSASASRCRPRRHA